MRYMYSKSHEKSFMQRFDASHKRKRTWIAIICIIISLVILLDTLINERIWSFNVGLRATIHKSQIYPSPSVIRRSETAHAQQLVLDIANCSSSILNDVPALIASVKTIVSALPEVSLVTTSVVPLDPEGCSILANLGDSFLSLQTWPQQRDALITLMVADPENQMDLRALLPLLGEVFQGNIAQSTFSIIPRGRDVDVWANQAYEPAEIMTRHQYKELISEVQSPFQNVAIWQHHDSMEESTFRGTQRSLFLDGVMQSSALDENQYHETLVQPAFIASSVPPKRVLIVGGGEGGTLRETLKWKSVQEAVMVDLDAEVVRSSRLYLPTYSNCTGFGTPSCFDDPRVSLYTTDFFKWFDEHIGQDICQTRHNKLDSLFDVIILDLLDTEELPEGQPWAEYLYSELFFQRIACATKDLGVVISNFGEAPETPFSPALAQVHYPEKYPSFETGWHKNLEKKIDQLRSFSHQFNDFRVFDIYIPAFRGPWAFAMGIVPRISQVTGTESKRGVTLFDGTPIQINYKLRQNIHPKAPMLHYNGKMQQNYRQSTQDWAGVFCYSPDMREKCTAALARFRVDEKSLWKVEETSDGKRTVIVTMTLPKGTVLGTWDEVDPDGVKLTTSMESSCEPNTAPLAQAEPWFGDKDWNPFLERIQTEVASAVVLLRDLNAGERLTRQGLDC